MIFNQPRYGFLDNSGINFVAFFCTRSNLSTSTLHSIQC